MKYETPDHTIAAVRPVLSGSEREAMFTAIKAQVQTPAVTVAVVSPYAAFIRNLAARPATYVATILIICVGTSGTMAVADAAKPGDSLFPIDRATEQIRLALVSSDHKAALEAEFIEERITEVKAIVAEEALVQPTTATATQPLRLNKKGEDRIAGAVAVLTDQLHQMSDQARYDDEVRTLKDSIDKLRGYSDDEELESRVEGNKIELRTSTERIRFEEKDGELRARYDRAHQDDHDDEESSGRVMTSTSSVRTDESEHDGDVTTESEVRSDDHDDEVTSSGSSSGHDEEESTSDNSGSSDQRDSGDTSGSGDSDSSGHSGGGAD